MSTDQFDSALDLLRRLPPHSTTSNLNRICAPRALANRRPPVFRRSAARDTPVQENRPRLSAV
ncbi:hypothetical protein ABVK25_000611 [Lepraria finkii]|uniref:Uncharacterized protein n=1 Tax=Lepraria finkii TaxID=1340010 RepID=A0ABR4BNE7_9LECA